MATFLMIHGAWHGGWCFEPLRPLLEDRGHVLIAPSLPGMDGGNVQASAVTLDLWAAFVADLARQQREPVILCGHSRGGIVISSVAEQAPECVSGLVYITAFMLPRGQSLRGFQTEAPNLAFSAALRPTADGSAIRFEPGAAAELLYHRCTEAVRRDAARRLVPEPAQPLVTPLSLGATRFGRVPRHYIECSDDRALLLVRQRAMQTLLPCSSVATLDSDHSPFLSCPEALVRALVQIEGRC